ncbi:MAG: hypothetical protein LBV43_08285 [Prevotella sp.]|jgi:hypothetical protein|nr:hypothetical protein [Prevotella sp.]
MKVSTSFIAALLALFMLAGYSCSDDDDKPEDETTDYFYYGEHSYLIVKKTKTWVEAAADAVSLGGYLVEIESKAEQDAVYKAIQDSKISSTYTKVTDGGGIGYIWIGATDRYQEGTWIWNGGNQSGTFPMFWFGSNAGSAVGGSYVNWGGTAAGSLNEPDNFTDTTYSPNGQNAAAIGLAKWPAGSSDELGRAGEWNDIAETNKLYYIVEFDKIK